jgi:hypothetical protein
VRIGGLAVVLAVAGCNRVLGLDATKLADAAACPGPDEDGDCVADLVDNCPGLFNPDQTDTDGDGVGDLCDPAPDLPTTKKAFYTFSGNGTSDWQATPEWVPDDAAGAVHHTDASDASLFTQLTSDDSPDLTVEATFLYHAHSSSVPNRMGVWVDTPFGVEAGQTCWIDAQNQLAEARESVGTGTELTTATAVKPLADGDRYTVQLRRVRSATNPMLYCTIFLDANPQPLPPDAGQLHWLTGGFTAISSDGTNADLLDVVLYIPSS